MDLEDVLRTWQNFYVVLAMKHYFQINSNFEVLLTNLKQVVTECTRIFKDLLEIETSQFYKRFNCDSKCDRYSEEH